MKSGFAALQQVMDEAKNRGDFSEGSLDYFSWKDKDRKVVRFLTDDVITADFHEFIQTNDGKTKSFLIDPAKGDLVAKYASPTPGLGWKQDFKTKQPVERKPASRTVGLAVLRDRVARAGGGFDIIDVIGEQDVDGQKLPTRTFGLITQSHGNFWKSLIGYYNLYSTLCDRDYLIERVGGGTDTEYTIIPLDPIEELRDINVVREFYGYGRPWNKEDLQRFLFCPQTLPEWTEYYSGEERVAHWLVPSSEPVAAATPSIPLPTIPLPTLPTPAAAAPPVVAQGPVPAAGLAEFHKDSTSNPEPADEAQAAPPPAPVQASADTNFASLRDKLLPHATAAASS